MLAAIRKGYVDIPTGQVHYRALRRATDGPGNPPLVLLHQTASSGAMFEELMALLADDFTTLAPDTPGFGGSDPLPFPFTVADLAEALHTALTGLGVVECYLFGHHTGAAIAVQMAHDHPGFVRRLALSGPPLLNPEQVSALLATLQPFALAEDGSHLIQTWARVRRRDPALPLSIVHREVLLTQGAGEAAAAAYHAVFAQPFAEQLAALDIPVLVMAGEHDTLRAGLEPSLACLRRGQGLVIPDAGPYVCDRRPEAVAAALRRFFLAA
jgi:pimeloyl-ACP methyl ester carboxylesterase